MHSYIYMCYPTALVHTLCFARQQLPSTPDVQQYSHFISTRPRDWSVRIISTW